MVPIREARSALEDCRYSTDQTWVPGLASMVLRSLKTVRQVKLVWKLRRWLMPQVHEQVVEMVQQEEEAEIVELSLTDLQRIGGGAGNAAIGF